MEAFGDVTFRAYGYLILNFSPYGEDSDTYRVRNKVFLEEDTILYQSLQITALTYLSIRRVRL